MQTQHLPVAIEKAASGSSYDARFVMSAATPDRVRDTIEPSAYKAAVKQDRIIALWQHDHETPIGFWSDLKAEGDRLVGHLKIASTNLGLMIKQLIADGVPLSASIGFRGRGEANKDGGTNFTQIELLECSVVSVPAHPRAVMIAKSFGLSSVIEDAPEAAQSGITSNETVARARQTILRANKELRK